ncbi:glycosyltransferase [Opitutales bacterium]|nr:glycosyltransferase [Opitutales bacterium]MDB2681510.1 glycosyltransferase [Opitutales bacterium]
MAKTYPKVTVRIPAYNHEKYVEQAVLSVVNQTYPNIELIVIDDGSSDRTPEILQRLSDAHGFHFESQENMGVTKTLNKITALATGEYICGVASDDYLEHDKIEKQVAYLESHPDVAFCHGRNSFVDAESNLIKNKDTLHKTKDWCEGDIFNELLKRGCFIAAPTVMMRLDALKEIGGYDVDCPIEDWDMWLKLAHRYKAGFIEDNLAYYRFHESNTYWDTRNYIKMYHAEKHILDKWSSTPGIATIMQRYYLRWFYRLSLVDRRIAFRYAIKALPSVTRSIYWKAWLRFASRGRFSKAAK